MCHNYAKHFFLFITLLVTGSLSFAQNSNKENSVYTRYGIGEFRNSLNTNLKGMANISSAYANEYNVNTDNPASYATLKLTTYELGGEGSMKTVLTNAKNYRTGMASLSYLTIGIPLGKHAGMAFGLKPYTRTYYQTTDSVDLAGIGPALRVYSGDGSINYAFLGFAGEYKGFSAGVNVGYLFGTTRNSSILTKQYDTVNATNSDFSTYDKVGGVYWKLGLMYNTRLNKNLALRVGGTFTLSQDVTQWRDNYALSWRISNGTSIYDTAIDVQNQKGKMTLPMSYSFGAQLLGNDVWVAGIDFSAAQWSQFRNMGVADSVASGTYRIAAGGEYTPNARSIYKYLNRVTYRLGVYYGTDYIKLRNTDLNYYGFTVGASLPFKRSNDRLHLAFEMGRRGTQTNGLVQENYYKFSFGISLNDKWFLKRKYE